MIQLTIKPIPDFENQGPFLDVELTSDGERINNTSISMTGTALMLYTPEDLCWAALRRLHEEDNTIPF